MSGGPLELFITGFVTVGLLFFVSLWSYYDRRDKHYYDRQRLRHVHHCIKCGKLYCSGESERASPCPQCGFANQRLHF